MKNKGFAKFGGKGGGGVGENKVHYDYGRYASGVLQGVPPAVDIPLLSVDTSPRCG